MCDVARLANRPGKSAFFQVKPAYIATKQRSYMSEETAVNTALGKKGESGLNKKRTPLHK